VVLTEALTTMQTWITDWKTRYDADRVELVQTALAEYNLFADPPATIE